jgi:Fe-S-cluster containining protein
MTTHLLVRDASVEICAVECGARCCRAPGYFTIDTLDLERLSLLAKIHDVLLSVHAHPSIPHYYAVDFTKNGGQCVFLDHRNLCKIYSQRPSACRKYPEEYQPNCILFEREDD